MPINLSKGQKVDLTKGNASLKHIMVGLGWDVNAFDSGSDFDLDASAFMCGANGKCPTEKEFVFYGNLEHPSGAVKHQGKLPLLLPFMKHRREDKTLDKFPMRISEL